MQQYELLGYTKQEVAGKKRRSGCFIPSGLLIVILMIIGFVVIRPGVFTVQPIGALPEGVTIIYYSRSSVMPFYV